MDELTAAHCLDIIDGASVWAGDWKPVALALREALETGRYLPRRLWDELRARTGPDGRRLSSVWNALRRDHLNVCWPHLSARRTLGELAAVTSRNWSAEALHERLVDHIDQKIERGSSQRIQSGELNRYVEHLETISSRDFRAETFELWQLVEWSERRQRGYFPEEDFHNQVLDILEAENQPWEAREDTRRRIFRSLPPRSQRYERFPIRKGSGEPRWIEEPCEPLKKIQRRIANILNSYRSAHPTATGFVKGRSTALHARYHAGATAAVSVDIRDFFPSITREQVIDALGQGPHLAPTQRRWANPFANWSKKAAQALGDLVCHPFKNVLPQGAPSSPPLANLVAAKLDRHVRHLVAERLPNPRMWTYSRYADDMVLSIRATCSDEALQDAYLVLLDGLREMGWRPAPEKTERWHRWEAGPLTVCGIEVPPKRDGQLRLPRRDRRRIRAAMHHYRTSETNDEDRGLLAYAYTVTGSHSYRVLSSEEARENLKALAHGLTPGGEATRHLARAWAYE